MRIKAERPTAASEIGGASETTTTDGGYRLLQLASTALRPL